MPARTSISTIVSRIQPFKLGAAEFAPEADSAVWPGANRHATPLGSDRAAGLTPAFDFYTRFPQRRISTPTDFDATQQLSRRHLS